MPMGRKCQPTTPDDWQTEANGAYAAVELARLLRYRLIRPEGYKVNLKQARAFIERARRRGIKPDQDEVTATIAEFIDVSLPVANRLRQGLRDIRELVSRSDPSTSHRIV